MEELTALFLLLAFGLFVLSQLKKVQSLKVCSLFVAVLSLSSALVDKSLTSETLTLVIVPSFFLFLMSLASLFDGGDRR